jgi:hypothetical protein
MTPDNVRQIRDAFTAVTGKRVSQDDFARAIGLTPSNGGERVRQFEDGSRETTGPIDRVIGYLSQSVIHLANCNAPKIFPEYVIGDCGAKIGLFPVAFMVRLWWPRFVARIDDEETFLRGLGLPFYEFERDGFITIIQWIDNPELFGCDGKFYAKNAADHFRAWQSNHHL